ITFATLILPIWALAVSLSSKTVRHNANGTYIRYIAMHPNDDLQSSRYAPKVEAKTISDMNNVLFLDGLPFGLKYICIHSNYLYSHNFCAASICRVPMVFKCPSVNGAGARGGCLGWDQLL
ncbi:hypothetical protein FOC1_g10007446, partial [Fusarium oxysporum f. sp. cubense race 1]